MRWLLALCLPAALALPATVHAQINVGGYVRSGVQFRLTGCDDPGQCTFLNFRNANVVGLKIAATPSATTEIRTDIAFRNINFSRIETLDDTGDITKVQPVDIRLNEAWMAAYDLFGAKGLDLSAGAMRIAWGTADGLNPTDIVNAYNLENATGFNRRLPSLAIQLGYAVTDFKLEVSAIPMFQAAALPVDTVDFTALGDPQDVFDLNDSSAEPQELRLVETPITTPEVSLENIQVALRARYLSPVGDFSLMFYRGFESLPQAAGTARLAGFQTINRIDLGVPLVYPKIMMAGADWRGALVEKLSGWVEVGVFFPEPLRLSAAEDQLRALVNLGRLDVLPDPIPTQQTQSDEVYVKLVAGLDYPVGEHVYLNLQYVRGIPTERQAADIHDYIVLLMRLTFLEGRLALATQGTFEIADHQTFGYQAGGSISYLHGDAARVSLGVTFQGGMQGASFRRFQDLSNINLGFEMSF